jgi:hypothetical protein
VHLDAAEVFLCSQSIHLSVSCLTVPAYELKIFRFNLPKKLITQFTRNQPSRTNETTTSVLSTVNSADANPKFVIFGLLKSTNNPNFYLEGRQYRLRRPLMLTEWNWSR